MRTYLRFALLLLSFQCAAFHGTTSADEDRSETLQYQGEIRIEGIARCTDLPRRMDLEPKIEPLLPEIVLRDNMVPFFRGLVENGPDNEIRIQAVQALGKIHQSGLADVSAIADAVAACLESAENDDLKVACAILLAQIGSSPHAPAVAKLCDSDHVAICRLVEPNFISWGGNVLQDQWLSRVRKPRENAPELVVLACEGLGKLKVADAEEPLFQLLQMSATDFSVRSAASRAAARFDQNRAFQLAADMCRGDLRQRLLACSLLSATTSNDGFERLIQLCQDDSGAVASQAWAAIFERDAKRLIPLLRLGVAHFESNVRLTVVKVLQKFPTEEHCGTLHDLCEDAHIVVRNAARRALRAVASDESHRPVVSKLAGNCLVDPSADWKRVEQSMVLLAELKQSKWQSACLERLTHERAEVFTTAAWLLHLMPDEKVAEEAGAVFQQRYELLQSGNSTEFKALNEQVTFLFQYVGKVGLASATELCRKQFLKSAGMPAQRAAGLWALGQSYRDIPDKSLIRKYRERIFDDSLPEPEDMYVRQKCVLALAAMNARETVADLKKAYLAYGEDTMLGQTSSFVLARFGDPQPKFVLPSSKFQDFEILPLNEN